MRANFCGGPPRLLVHMPVHDALGVYPLPLTAQDSRMRTPRFLLRFAIILVTVALSGFVSAQQPQNAKQSPATRNAKAGQQASAAEDVDAITKQAYELANSARTLEGFTRALRLCGKATKSNPTRAAG